MDIELFKAACFVMVIGMGTVYLFICLMICAMNISAKVLNFINKYFPEEAEEDKTVSKKKTSNDTEIALAIACAVNERSKAC